MFIVIWHCCSRLLKQLLVPRPASPWFRHLLDAFWIGMLPIPTKNNSPPPKIQALCRSPKSTITTKNSVTKRWWWAHHSAMLVCITATMLRINIYRTSSWRYLFFSFPGEITALAGCDLLTISPKLLADLGNSTEPIVRTLDPVEAKKVTTEKISLNEANFRWLLNEDQMATDKLSDGIRKFAADSRKLEQVLWGRFSDAK